jgi:AcrR family transcriptional regulator
MEVAGAPDKLMTVPTGRHGLPPDIVATYQRERLLAATIELVAKRGYRSTSIDHIVKSARVGYVAFYELFEGKEECFLAAFDRIVEETGEALAAAVAAETGWPEQICAALDALLDLIAADPTRARVGLVEVQAAGRKAYARYEEAIDAAVPKLREGRALSAEAPTLSNTLEEAILGGIAWILHQRLVKGEIGETRGLLGETIQIALSPYLGEAEAHRLAVAASGERPSDA